MEEKEIKRLEKELEKMRIPGTENLERLKRIYKLCIAGLIPYPEKRLLKWGEFCPNCGQKLASEIVYCFNHLFCSCGYEWTHAITFDDGREEIIKGLKKEAGSGVRREV